MLVMLVMLVLVEEMLVLVTSKPTYVRPKTSSPAASDRTIF